MSLLTKIVGDPNRREISRHRATVDRINALEEEMQKLSDAELAAKTEEFRKTLGVTGADMSLGQEYTGSLDETPAEAAAIKRTFEAEKKKEQEALDAILPEAFAVVREMAKRVLGMRHYDVQLIGGIVLHEGKIAEMRTGEGKTLVATLALYLNALLAKGAHLVTVNDYLARRDAGWNAPLYHALGMQVGIIAGQDQQYVYDPEYTDDSHHDERLQHLRPCDRREAYAADITYATNNELGFDYLRDNMARSLDACRQRRLHYAIVDEVDSILIDEARTPLIISGQGAESTKKYYDYAQIVRTLVEEEDYTVDEKTKSVALTEEGIGKVERGAGIRGLFDIEHVADAHQANKALLAKALYLKDREYIVRDGEVIIVDEFTGRTMPGRRWSDGLHQAVEAKEGLRVQPEQLTHATITFQNFFRIYTKLAGMTGTALTEAEEFHKIYGLEVVPIPTHKPTIRSDQRDLIYGNEKAKFKAVVDEIVERHKTGQPILVGTTSIEKSERLARELEKKGVPHNVLNAKKHEQEAEIVANAGQEGAVTIATNMAGRGTDIVLSEAAREAGGLYIIGTERHESRRIDNQLRGRSGRQGDPGETRFFLSFDDDVMRIFGGERMQGFMERFGFGDEVIESRIVSKQLESAQTSVEGQHFDARRHVVQFDDVMNRQREIIYGERRKILQGTDTRKNVLRMIEMVVAREVPNYCGGKNPQGWDIEGLWERMRQLAPLDPFEEIDPDSLGETPDEVAETISGTIITNYEERDEKYGSELVRVAEQQLMLKVIDDLWVPYLTQMDHLRENIGFQAYGQKDQFVEFKSEAFLMFNELVAEIETEIVRILCNVQLQPVEPGETGGEAPPGAAEARVAEGPRADRAGSAGKDGAAQADPLASPPAARPAAAAASEKLARTQSRSRGPATPGGATNLVESSSAGTRQVAGDPADPANRKVGRNEPCPCGSGKKFKVCHGR